MIVPVGVITGLFVALIVQATTSIFWAGSLYRTVNEHSRRLSDLEPKLDSLRMEFAAHQGKEEE
jgi:hypothetical protein